MLLSRAHLFCSPMPAAVFKKAFYAPDVRSRSPSSLLATNRRLVGHYLFQSYTLQHTTCRTPHSSSDPIDPVSGQPFPRPPIMERGTTAPKGTIVRSCMQCHAVLCTYSACGTFTTSITSIRPLNVTKLAVSPVLLEA